ncbi:MAG: hypothetical protein RJA07_836 [Bacteroidota bacterium]|jgi:hypothetical protein
MKKTTTTQLHSTLKFKPSKILLIMMLVAFGFLKTNSAQAQTTTADSVLTVTDSSIVTNTNITVTDSSGNTTLFAGGQQSGYSGNVGIGTNQPASKLSVYDDKNASFRLSQPVGNNNSQMRTINGSNGETIRNFEIDILNEPLQNDYRQIGDVVLSSYGSEQKPNITQLKINPNVYDPSANNLLPFCAQNINGTMSFVSTSMGWMTYELDQNGCPTQSENLQMYLSNSGDLALYNGSFAVKDLFKVNKNDGITYAKEIKVQATPFPPDFVFNIDYKMMSLHELEQYVNANHHLPEVPSAAEQTANGINVAQMQAKLLQKVEELTLIIIEQNKRIEELEKKK